jgi:hypothetical protein
MTLKSVLKRMVRPFWREADFYIGGKENPYLLRWWVIPRNRFFNIYLHKFLRDDDDRALHDHPWASCSIILKGGYIEYQPDKTFLRKCGRIYFRHATQAHRIELYRDVWCYGCGCWHRHFGHTYPGVRIRPAWSLFITGPKIREWGFHCPKGWIHWTQFCDETDHGNTGRGCE